MIRRAPLPQRDFAIFSNSLIRDKRLSFRARGLLMMMLSYPPEWKFTREWLADQSAHDGVTAVRSALQELERSGYLVRRRIRVKGRFAWERMLYDEPQETADVDPDSDDAIAVTTGGLPAGGTATGSSTAAVNQPSKEVLERSTEEEDVMASPASRFASLSGTATKNDQDRNEKLQTPSWRDQDLDLFRDLLGGDYRALKSEGGEHSRWGEGIWSIEAFYVAFRERDKHRWPGRRLQTIVDEGGFEHWLLDQGLEIVGVDEWTRDRRRCTKCQAHLVNDRSQKAGLCFQCRRKRAQEDAWAA